MKILLDSVKLNMGLLLMKKNSFAEIRNTVKLNIHVHVGLVDEKGLFFMIRY